MVMAGNVCGAPEAFVELHSQCLSAPLEGLHKATSKKCSKVELLLSGVQEIHQRPLGMFSRILHIHHHS